jgi:hypothetical protein
METYRSDEIASILNHYAEYIRLEIDGFDKASTLPTMGAKAEIRGRKIAADILKPIADAIGAYASQYASVSASDGLTEPTTLTGSWDYDI